MNRLLLLAWIIVAAAGGDTMTLRDGSERIQVRLAEIDAPERTQPYSQVSRRNLIALCKDKPIESRRLRSIAIAARWQW